eukprot:964803_1
MACSYPKCPSITVQKKDLMRCGKCKNQLYCCRICQTKDWRVHKHSCCASTTNQNGSMAECSPAASECDTKVGENSKDSCKSKDAINRDANNYQSNIDLRRENNVTELTNGEQPELYETQIEAEVQAQSQFNTLRAEHGLADERTLKVAFVLLDLWIGLYKLDLTNNLLEDLVPACLKRYGTRFNGIQYKYYSTKSPKWGSVGSWIS